EALIGTEQMRYHERMIMLSVLDQQWKDHLLSMDHLKEGIGLRGYAQHDPLVEYKKESFDMFEAMMRRFEEETVRYLYLMQVIDEQEAQRMRERAAAEQAAAQFTGATLDSPGDGNGARRPRLTSTSIDEIEADFRRRKERELQQARMAGSGDLT